MTEQQYRTIADRDKGDDPQLSDIEVGDRFTYVAVGRMTDRLVRIERLVPTPDENVYVQSIRAFVDSERLSPRPPTREQIAEALYRSDWPEAVDPTRWDEIDPGWRDDYLRLADAALALIQNGADR